MRDQLTVTLAGLVIVATAATIIGLTARPLGVILPAFTGFALRLAYGLTNYWSTRSANNDGSYYDQTAQAISKAWAEGGAYPTIVTGKEGWPYILAAIYATIGHAPEAAIALNAVAGAFTIVVAAYICVRLEWYGATRPTAWIVSLWPVSLLWGPLLLREALVGLLLAVGLLGAILVRTRAMGSGLALLAASGVAMIWMRGGLAFLLLVGLPVLVTASAVLSQKKLSGSARSIVLAPAAVMVAFPFLTRQFQSADYFEQQRLATVRDALDTGSTGFSAAGIAPGNTAIVFLNVGIGPFPWTWTNAGLMAAGLDAVLWIGVWLYAIRGALGTSRNRWAILLFVVPTIALIGYLTGSATNFGLIMRLRALMLPYMAPLAGLGIAAWLETRRHLVGHSADVGGNITGAPNHQDRTQDAERTRFGQTPK